MSSTDSQDAERCPEREQEVSAEGTCEKVLLVNPAVHDSRLPWARWQQPTLLLRLSTLYKASGADVRLIDCLHHALNKRLRKRLAGHETLEGQRVNRWRFGTSEQSFEAELERFKCEQWEPTCVYVECFTTYWWQGCTEAVATVRKHFPRARIVLVGAYALLAPKHAIENTGAELVPVEHCSSLANLAPDLSLYAHRPTFQYVTLGAGHRTADEIVDEVAVAVSRKVCHFAFPEHGIASEHRVLFREILERLAAKELRANFYAFGNISAGDLCADPELPALMRRARYRQISFSDDREGHADDTSRDLWLEQHREAAALCHEAGFPMRKDSLIGAVCVGRPGEDLQERAHAITLLSHYVGSVVPWPYQPTPDELPDVPLELQNGKFFPFRGRNRLSFRDYADLLGLAAVLNSKYRDRTFDFLGDSLVAQLFQDSVRREGWNPPEEIKGSLRLPVLAR
jgi:hypothetical protein